MVVVGLIEEITGIAIVLLIVIAIVVRIAYKNSKDKNHWSLSNCWLCRLAKRKAHEREINLVGIDDDDNGFVNDSHNNNDEYNVDHYFGVE